MHSGFPQVINDFVAFSVRVEPPEIIEIRTVEHVARQLIDLARGDDAVARMTEVLNRLVTPSPDLVAYALHSEPSPMDRDTEDAAVYARYVEGLLRHALQQRDITKPGPWAPAVEMQYGERWHAETLKGSTDAA